MVKKEEEEGKGKEGKNLLGRPKFKKLENGRFKCVETGYEVPSHAKDSYAQSKHCRIGLIDAALARNKPPLNMFHQDPLVRSKLICKLTGDIVNKSEEHIWKHINGKRFLNMLDKKEAEKEMPNGIAEQDEQPPENISKPKADSTKKKKKKQEEDVAEVISEVKNSSDKVNGTEEVDLWMPPVGERWDFDDGGDRRASDSESGSETEDANGAEGNEQKKKRMKADSDISRPTPSMRNQLDALASLKGEQVAARVTQENAERDEWFVVKVIHFDRETREFEVLDEEPGDDEEGGGQSKYKLPLSHIIPFPKRNDPSGAPDFPPGKQVLAVYPSAAALYKATVVQPRKRKADDYVLEFDDDEDEDGSLPQRIVPFHRVVGLPDGHRQ